MNLSIDLPYFPRGNLVEQVFKTYASGLKQGVTLFAPRRQGKTSFVKHELLPAAQEQGWQTIYIDLWRRRNEPDLALVEGLEAELERRQKGLLRRLVLKKVKSKTKIPGQELETELEPLRYAAENVPENRLEAALTALVGDRITLLVLDEVQALADVKRENFVAALRTVIQNLQGKLFVFYTGSSRDGLNSMFRARKAPLFASAMPLQLEDLGRDYVEDRAAFLESRSPTPVSADVLEAVFDRLGRTPEFLNEVVLHLIIAGDGDVEGAVARWKASLTETDVGNLLSDLKPLEAALMQLLAKPEPPSLFGAEGIAELRALAGDETVNPPRVQNAIKRLTRMGLVGPTGKTGSYEIEDRAMLFALRDDIQ